MPSKYVIQNRTLAQVLRTIACCILATLLALSAFIRPVYCRAVIPNNGSEDKLKVGPLQGNGNSKNGIGLSALEPPKHMDGVKMDMDGELNKEFRQELFLGPDHEDFDSIPEKEGRKRLKDIFNVADTNRDEYLSQEELVKWIHRKTEEHFQEAMDSSRRMLPFVDVNNDGVLFWDEYKKQFLLQRGYDEKKQQQLALNEQILNANDEDDYILYRDRWGRADEDGDDALNPEEFLAFLHPEHCKSMLAMLVEEILHDLDRDGDKALSLAEFVSLPEEDAERIDDLSKDDEWIRERKKEFMANIDLNGDGVASMEELEKYMDPQNIQHAESEARHLIGAADINEDNKLSLREILDNYFVFVGSKLYNYARNVHDEF